MERGHSLAVKRNKVRLGKTDGATSEQMARLRRVVKNFKTAAKLLRLHQDTEIKISFDKLGGAEPGADADQQWLMQVDCTRGDYMRWRVSVSPKCLEAARDKFRVMDVIHETLHMLFYEYGSLAESVASNRKAVDALRGREERVVTHLEQAIASLIGVGEFDG